LGQGGLLISQSGETADTLAALRYLKGCGHKALAIVNVAESSLAREADGTLRTYAGPEIGVASTKAFTTQLATLACLAIGTARARADPAERRARARERPRPARPAVREDRLEPPGNPRPRRQDHPVLGRGGLRGARPLRLALRGATRCRPVRQPDPLRRPRPAP